MPRSPEEVAAYKAAWARANRARLNEKNAEWRRNNPDKQALSERNVRARQKELGYPSQRLWQRQNRSRANQATNAWKRNNRGRVRVSTNRWRAANHDRVIAFNQARYARKIGAEGTFTAAEWRALKATYNSSCLCCGRAEPEIRLTPDHVVPLAKGGSNWISNIQPLCGPCNSSKQDKYTDYR